MTGTLMSLPDPICKNVLDRSAQQPTWEVRSKSSRHQAPDGERTTEDRISYVISGQDRPVNATSKPRKGILMLLSHGSHENITRAGRWTGPSRRLLIGSDMEQQAPGPRRRTQLTDIWTNPFEVVWTGQSSREGAGPGSRDLGIGSEQLLVERGNGVVPRPARSGPGTGGPDEP